MLKTGILIFALLGFMPAFAEEGAPGEVAKLVQTLMNKESPPEYARLLRNTTESALFLKELCAIGGLPGVVRGAHGRVDATYEAKTIDVTFPARFSYRFREEGEPKSESVYEVTKASEGAPWHLASAVRKPLDSGAEEVLSLPSVAQESKANMRVAEEIKEWGRAGTTQAP